MALISGCTFVLMWILENDFSGHYNRLALISVDIISGIYCTADSAYSGRLGTGFKLPAIPDGSYIRSYFCTGVRFGVDLSVNYNWLPLIPMGIISGVYCIVDSAYSGRLATGLKWPQYPMTLISSHTFVLK